MATYGIVGPRVGVDDLGDPAAADPGQRADLAGQPGAGLVVADDVRAQHLERHPVAAGRAREVDDAHAALADAREQRVVAHPEPGRAARAAGAGSGAAAVVTGRGYSGGGPGTATAEAVGACRRAAQTIRCIQPKVSSARPYWMSTSALRTAIVTGPASVEPGTSPPSHLSVPTGVTTAAVPQAKTSVIRPLATPSRHSSMETFRSSTWWPSLPASSMMLERVMPSRMVPVSGVTMRPSS